jgi:predicted ArsR family transcriptional regulator
MQPTQKKVLDFLQTHPGSSASEISRSLGMTPANIRYHLQALTASQLVVETGMRAPGGRGRPVVLFSLHQHAMAHNLDRLAGALLHCWLLNPTSGSLESKVNLLAREIATSFTLPSGSLTANLGSLIQQLNLFHYQARWEAHAKGPLLRLYNCPYAEILPQHPELCRVDLQLVQELLHHPTKQISKITNEFPCCTFQILNP